MNCALLGTNGAIGGTGSARRSPTAIAAISESGRTRVPQLSKPGGNKRRMGPMSYIPKVPLASRLFHSCAQPRAWIQRADTRNLCLGRSIPDKRHLDNRCHEWLYLRVLRYAELSHLNRSF